MSSLIPEEKITEVKNTADILEVISDSVILKRAGRNHKGLCPFHSEKTPSFTVDPEKQMFKCFGCGEGGNVYTFLMKRDGVSFPEAVRMLGRRYGIEVMERNLSPAQRNAISEREHLYAINAKALGFFRRMLLEGEGGHIARGYLQKRGFGKETLDLFMLGYVPEGWNNLARSLEGEGVPLALAEKAGLLVANERGGYYDRFRSRIIFPIYDIAGQVTGFGGRVMDDAQPKYLNSPETPVYHKGRSLYGLNRARRMCRQTGQVLIVEGYFDLLALWQHGIENVTATLGTALTAEHIRLLKGYAPQMVLVYDSDEAGIKAALRSVELFSQAEVDARILVLPEGYDPDAFVFEQGAERFSAMVDQAASVVQFLMDVAVKRHGLSIEGKVRVISSMVAPLAAMRDSVARALYVRKLAERVGVDEVAILEKVRTAAGRVPMERSAGGQTAGRDVRGPMRQPGAATGRGAPPGSRMERQIVAMMLQFAEIRHEMIRYNVLDFFEDKALKEIAGLVLSEETPDVADLVTGVDPEKRRIVSALTIGDEQWHYEGCVRAIQQFVSSRNRVIDRLLMEIKAAEEAGDHDLLLQLLNKKQILAENGR